MKKYLLPLVLLFVSIAVFAQNDDEYYQKGYNFGRKYGLIIIIAVIVLIVFIIARITRKRKT